MARPRISDDIRASVVELMKAGQSARSAARQIGICHKTALAWYREDTGQPVGYRTPEPARKWPREKWAAEYRKGLTTGQIAVKYGVSPWSVIWALRKMSPTRRVSDLREGANG